MKGKAAETRPEPARPKTSIKERRETSISTAPSAAAEIVKPEPVETSRPLPDREPTGAAVERVSFKVEDGKIVLDSVRKSSEPRVREIFRASVSDPTFREWSGLAAAPEAPAMELVKPPLVGNLLDLSANVEAFLLAKKSGLPYEEVRKIIAWTQSEHLGRNGDDGLDAQGARLANKYIPPEWLAKVDLWLFLGTLVTLTGIKIQMLNAHAKQSFERTVSAPSHDESKRPEPAPAPAPAPVAESNNGSQSFEAPA